MEKWVISAKRADFQAIGKEFGIDPVTARLIRNRDVISVEDIRLYLKGSISDLPSLWLMKDIEKAADLLRKKIENRKKIEKSIHEKVMS